MVVLGQKLLVRIKVFYSGKSDFFQSGCAGKGGCKVGICSCIRAKLVVLGQNLLYSCKVVVFGQSCILAKVVVFGQKLLYSGKVVLFGKIGTIWVKVVVFGVKLLYSDKRVVFGQKCLCSGKSGCI